MELTQTDIFSVRWCNIVFDGRNIEYGAYALRKHYAKNALIAALTSITVFLLSVSTPMIIEFFSGTSVDDSITKMGEVINLSEAPPINIDNTPPPLSTPPPPLKTTVKFTAPVIVKDEEAIDTVRAQDAFKDDEAGTKTQKGDTSGIDSSLIETKIIADMEPGEPPTYVQQMPEFPGGEMERVKYMHDNIKYPRRAIDAVITGTVYLSFIVDKEGKISDVKLLRGIGGGCDEEAIRVVKGMPRWKPGRQNGTPVKVLYNYPIKFTLKSS